MIDISKKEMLDRKCTYGKMFQTKQIADFSVCLKSKRSGEQLAKVLFALKNIFTF
jgi:hypothetical protein